MLQRHAGVSLPGRVARDSTFHRKAACQAPASSILISFAIERRVFRRDPISYALETDWPVGAAGFEPLHFESDPLVSVIP